MAAMKRKLGFTRHAAKRLAQRGFREDDIDLIVAIGTEVEGGYFVRDKDIRSIECGRKRQEHIKRLAGKRVVLKNGRIVTAYHAKRSKERRLLREHA